MKILFACIVLSMGFFLSVSAPRAQEVTPDRGIPADLEETDFISGNVTHRSETVIQVQSYDAETGQLIATDFMITDDSKPENFESFDEIQVGDGVEINYTSKNSEKVILYVSLVKSDEEPKRVFAVE